MQCTRSALPSKQRANNDATTVLRYCENCRAACWNTIICADLPTCKPSQLRRRSADPFLRCDTIPLSPYPRVPPPSEGRGQARAPPGFLCGCNSMERTTSTCSSLNAPISISYVPESNRTNILLQSSRWRRIKITSHLCLTAILNSLRYETRNKSG